jgi:hypothetical protein
MPDDGPLSKDEAERAEAERARLEDPNASVVEKVLAVVEGIAEGFALQSEETNLPKAAGQAVEKASQSVQAVRQGITQGYAPAPATDGATGSAAGAAAATSVADELIVRADVATAQARTDLSRLAEERAQRLQRISRAAGESAGRAKGTPAALRFEAQLAVRDMGAGARRAVVGFVVGAIFTIFAIALFTIAIDFALNRALGWPWGSVLLGIIYVLIAVAAWMQVREGANDIRARTRGHLRAAAQRVRSIREPFDALGRAPPAY